MDQQITRELAAQTGISFDLVQFLRDEFKKIGRNPLDSSIEILAIENGLNEDAVKVSVLSLSLSRPCSIFRQNFPSLTRKQFFRVPY